MTNQFLHHELFIGQTHDAFVLEAKSISAAREEAKGILREYFIGKTPRQITSIVKSSSISAYTSPFETPAFLEEKDRLSTVTL